MPLKQYGVLKGRAIDREVGASPGWWLLLVRRMQEASQMNAHRHSSSMKHAGMVIAATMAILTPHWSLAQADTAASGVAPVSPVNDSPKVILVALNNGTRVDTYPFVRPPQIGEVIVLRGGIRWTVKQVLHTIDQQGKPVLEIGIAPPPPPVRR